MTKSYPPHRMSQYADGNVWVEFCTVCSAEGEELKIPCPGEYISTDTDKKIDTDKEPS